MDKNIFFELNKDIYGWNIGTKMDVYFDFYIFLIKKYPKQAKFVISNKELEKFYEEYKKSKVNKFGTIRRQFEPQFTCLKLATFEKTKVTFTNALVNKQINIDEMNNFFTKKITSLDIDEKITKEELRWIYSLAILGAYKHNILQLQDISSIKGKQSNLSDRFIRDYFTNYQPLMSKSKYINELTLDDLQAIVTFLRLIAKNTQSIEFKVRQKDPKPKLKVMFYRSKPFNVNIIKTTLNRDNLEQAKFRLALITEAQIKNKECCWLCGKYNVDLCEAAHIVPHKIGKFSVYNGMLLCSNCHKMFDEFFIGISPNGTVISNNSRMNKHGDFDTSGLRLDEVFLTKERRKFLKVTYDKFNATL